MNKLRVLLLDNYDSFTYNLVDYLERSEAIVEVVRNDQFEPHELARTFHIDALVLSPGPQTPPDAGMLMQTVAYFLHRVPMLGVCLGHQAIGMHCGYPLQRAIRPMHGMTSLITHNAQGIFNELQQPMTVMRYHSLVIGDADGPLYITARTDDNQIMACAHEHLPVWGVQFHPESIGTPQGLQLLTNWVQLAHNHVSKSQSASL